MLSTGKNKLFFSYFFLLTATVSQAQLVDLTRTPPYSQVFAETDAFDSSTNAIKYSFAESQTAETATVLVFRLSDNGIRKQQNTNPKGTGFGTELVNLLVQQLEGKLTADFSNGTTITIHFKNRKPH